MATAETIDRVFAMYHATYGDIALTRLASGVPDAEGQDTGLTQARAWWHRQLARYTDQVVELSAKESTNEHKRFPPTLPQLRDLCEAETRRRSFKPYALPHDCRGPTPADLEALRRLRDRAAAREAQRVAEELARGVVR